MIGSPRPPHSCLLAPRRRGPGPVRPAACLTMVLAWLLVAMLAPDTARAGSGRWQWPLDPPHEVVRPFEPPEHEYGAGHRGIDVAVADTGAPVRAVEDGTVRFAGPVAGRGVVSVLHADGLISTYEPVTASVGTGDAVLAGDVLGEVAAGGAEVSHCDPGPCLHLGARRGESYVDPMLLLGLRGPSVLLRWDGGPPAASAGAEQRPSGTERQPRTVGETAAEVPAAAGAVPSPVPGAGQAPVPGQRRALAE